MKKLLVLLIIGLGIGITSLVLVADHSVIKPLQDLRSNIVSDIKEIDSFESEEGLLVLSAGVTASNDNFFSLDLIQKKLLAYEWIGGVGHIDRDLRLYDSDEIFQLSLQVSNEEQFGTPYIFGIINDESILSVKVQVLNKTYESTMIQSDDEVLYLIELETLENSHSIVLIIEYTDGTKETFYKGDDIDDILSGAKVIYHYR